MVFKLDDKTTSFNFVSFLNASFSIAVTVSGISIFSNNAQLKKADASILSSDDDNLTSLNPFAPLKAPSSIVFTLSGILIVFNFSHPLNNRSATLVVPSSKETFSRPLPANGPV